MVDVAWRPQLEDVAVHLRPFTRDSVGREHGTFTADTAVSDWEVERVLDGIVSDIAGYVGTVPEALEDAAGRVAAIGAAANAVVDIDSDLAQILWDWYTQRLTRLREEVVAGDEDAGGVLAITSGEVLGEFPCTLFTTTMRF
jgi:hypothetical protein